MSEWKLVPVVPTKEMKAACRVAGKTQVWDDMIAAAPKPEAELSDLRVMVQELLPLLYGNIQISKTHLDELRELAYAPHAPSELVKASELAHREICRLDYSHNRVAMSLRAELDKVKS